MKPVKIIGFTPLGVILAERFSFPLYNNSHRYTDITLIEQNSSSEVDSQWQSVSLLCLLNLLKQCRTLLSDNSKTFGIDVKHITLNQQQLYSYIQSSIENIQKYYLSLLKKRQVKFELCNSEHQTDNVQHKYQSNDEHEPHFNNLSDDAVESFRQFLTLNSFESPSKKSWANYFCTSNSNSPLGNDESDSTYMITYARSSYHEFDQSQRLNVFHTLFQYLLSCSSVKLIGPDIFAFELAHLLFSLGHNEVYFYRMHPNESSIIPLTETNANLVTLLQVFSKFVHEPLISNIPNTKKRTVLHIIEKYHKFKINPYAHGQLEYGKFIQPSMPDVQTLEETRKRNRTYLQTFKQQTHELFSNASTSNTRINEKFETKEEEPDDFSPSSTFFVLIDLLTSLDKDKHTELEALPSYPNAIQTFNSSPSSFIFNTYEALRQLVGDKTTPQLVNIFLSVDRELCVTKIPTEIDDHPCEMGKVLQSPQHDLKRSIENLHDLYKIIQRPIDDKGQSILYESQLFLNDALDLQSLLMLFDNEREIPQNELLFLFRHEYDWYNQLVLPDPLIIKEQQ